MAIVPHQGRAQATNLAREAIGWLTEHGHEPIVPTGDADACGLEEWALPEAKFDDSIDLAVSLGGDGTMLRAVDLVTAGGTPVLGVNVGHLGYLTECEPDALLGSLKRFFDGDHSIEERMTLAVAVGNQPPALALNEAWVEKTQPGHTVRMAVTVGGEPFVTYAADGLIVATPTGSTAYNLSVRGPIASPTLRALIMTPVSPHQLFDFSLVLEGDEEVAVEILDGRSATLLVDGREVCELGAGERVTCKAGPRDAKLVTFGPRNFHRIVKQKFGLTDR
ncbi:MAG: NAD(+)/NADH kinase [Acidimicrobiales bacterium]